MRASLAGGLDFRCQCRLGWAETDENQRFVRRIVTDEQVELVAGRLNFRGWNAARVSVTWYNGVWADC